MTALRRYFAASGDTAKASSRQSIKCSRKIASAQTQIDRAIASAAQVENAMDGYDGLPTAAQLHEVDWAWEDAAAAANALNKVITESVPAAYSAWATP